MLPGRMPEEMVEQFGPATGGYLHAPERVDHGFDLMPERGDAAELDAAVEASATQDDPGRVGAG